MNINEVQYLYKIIQDYGIFNKLHQYLHESVLINLYYSLVYPYLIYCNVVFGDTYDIYLRQLTLLQNKLWE